MSGTTPRRARTTAIATGAGTAAREAGPDATVGPGAGTAGTGRSGIGAVLAASGAARAVSCPPPPPSRCASSRPNRPCPPPVPTRGGDGPRRRVTV
ncbi:hypothetical protein GXW82_37715 [Streptacidiphilus sp. 4-A2]|nr:hypothetical protein [Streptacidiphilus sp. 4-A2]